MDKGQAFDTCSLLDEQIFLETGHRNRYMGVRRILQGLILDMQPKVIVEIGVFRGHTTACMALTAEKVGARIYAIDPNMSRRPGRIAR
jgi:predicted O-methyltransferase YrrM